MMTPKSFAVCTSLACRSCSDWSLRTSHDLGPKEHSVFYCVSALNITYVCCLLKSQGNIFKQNCSDIPQTSSHKCGVGLMGKGALEGAGDWVGDHLLPFTASNDTFQSSAQGSRACLGSAYQGVTPRPLFPASGAPTQPFPQPQHHQQVWPWAKCRNICLLTPQFPRVGTVREVLLLL